MTDGRSAGACGAAKDDWVIMEAYDAAIAEKLELYRKSPSAKTLSELESVRAARSKLAGELQAATEPAGPPPYKNRLEALAALEADGWKVKKSKLYRDCKSGLLRVQADGSVRRSDLDSYVLRGGLSKAAAVGGGMERDQAERLQLENEKLRRQIEKLVFDNERDKGRYLLRDDVRAEQAMKIGALQAGIKHWARTGAADLIYAVGGDAAKARVFINLFEARLDELMDEMGRMEEIGIVIRRLEEAAT